MTKNRPAVPNNWRNGWRIEVRPPAGRQHDFPSLRDSPVLAYLPGTTSVAALEVALVALLQSHVQSDDNDRFDYVVEEVVYQPVSNASGRVISLDVSGLPE